MNVFLARQPIFDLNKEIYGYEILYRRSLENRFTQEVEAAKASSNVVFDTFQSFGLDNLTSGKPAFINFPEALIEEEIATLFPKEHLVVEILETVRPTPSIVKKCWRLKEAGYQIALDDFVYAPGFEPLLDLANIIKIDFLDTSRQQMIRLKELLGSRQAILLAEKVETWDNFHLAQELGFELFQGYFFSKPEIVTTNNLSPLEINYFRLIEAVNQEEMDFDVIARIVTQDVSLTYHLLKLVNSVYFGQRQHIGSVKQALVVLGELEIRKWMTLVALLGMSGDGFSVPVTLSLLRARFAELLGQAIGLTEYQEELFLTGLFSMLDVLLQRAMQQILSEVHAPQTVQEALLNHSGPFWRICVIVRAYEEGDWGLIEKQAAELKISGSQLTKLYLEAIRWHPHGALLQKSG